MKREMVKFEVIIVCIFFCSEISMLMSVIWIILISFVSLFVKDVRYCQVIITNDMYQFYWYVVILKDLIYYGICIFCLDEFKEYKFMVNVNLFNLFLINLIIDFWK